MVKALQTVIKQSEIYQKYIRPFQLVEKFNLKCGYEKSFKFTRGKLLRNRYLLGIERSQLDTDRLQVICQQMNMPESHYQQFLDQQSDANLVLLGFEESDGGASYRIYLEFWDKIRETIKLSQSPFPPQKMFLGFKWNAFDNSRSTITIYRYYPITELTEMLQRLAHILDSDEGRQMLEITRNLLSRSLKQTSCQALVYLEASEVGNPRKSFDINLYRAGMRVSQIRAQLTELCQMYAVSGNEFEELFANAGSRSLGHISGGVDRRGQSFFTVYYEAG